MMGKDILTKEKIYKFLFLNFIIFLLYFDYHYYSSLFRDSNFNRDFTLFYKIGLRFLNGESLYQVTFIHDNADIGDHYLYPPFFACIFSFFTFISHDSLYRIFLILNFILLFFVSYWLKELVLQKKEKKFLTVPILWILLASSTSCCSTQYEGQVNIIVLAVIVASIFYEVKNKHIIAGTCLALACYIKMSPIVLVLPLLKFKKWSMLKSFFISVLLITIVVAFLSPQGWGIFVDFVQHLSTNVHEMDDRNIAHNFSKMLATFFPITAFNPILLIKTWIILFFIIITFRIKWGWSEDFIKLSSLYIFAMLCISPITWIHHFIWLAFPLTVLGAEFLREKKYFLFFVMYLFYFLTPIIFLNLIIKLIKVVSGSV